MQKGWADKARLAFLPNSIQPGKECAPHRFLVVGKTVIRSGDPFNAFGGARRPVNEFRLGAGHHLVGGAVDDQEGARSDGRRRPERIMPLQVAEKFPGNIEGAFFPVKATLL